MHVLGQLVDVLLVVICRLSEQYANTADARLIHALGLSVDREDKVVIEFRRRRLWVEVVDAREPVVFEHLRALLRL